MAPVVASPLKERGYSGDDTLESLLYSIVTGDKMTREELDKVGERIFGLHRALTIRDMGTKEMRKEHDTFPDWVFKDPQDRAPLTPGTTHMEKNDLNLGMDMFYNLLGWDKATGSPTEETYKKLKLGYVAEEFKKKGLLP
jgi:aldehyde:ferredoxin oxidoreductase